VQAEKDNLQRQNIKRYHEKYCKRDWL